jgi:hypothetical protein
MTRRVHPSGGARPRDHRTFLPLNFVPATVMASHGGKRAGEDHGQLGLWTRSLEQAEVDGAPRIALRRKA